MIITCPCGDKKFNVDASLIPNEGRTLQCGFCEEKWHFKPNNKKLENDYIKKDIKIKKIDPKENVPSEVDKIISEAEKISVQKNISIDKTKLNAPLINMFILFLITFVACIIILDTFAIFSKLPTEVPPNFNTIIFIDNFILIFIYR